MASTSAAQAQADLVSLVRGSSLPSGIAKVSDGEPATPIDGTAAVYYLDDDADFFRYVVAAYVRVSDAADAQARMLAMRDALDERLNTSAQFGPSGWSREFDRETATLRIITVVSTGRQDYY